MVSSRAEKVFSVRDWIGRPVRRFEKGQKSKLRHLRQGAVTNRALELTAAGPAQPCEWTMSTYRLDSLFSPRSIAVIGASPRDRSVGRAILRNLRDGGFAGDIHVINARYPEIDGIRTVPRLDDLPAPPDLAVIAAPAQAVPDIVSSAAERGVGSRRDHHRRAGPRSRFAGVGMRAGRAGEGPAAGRAELPWRDGAAREAQCQLCGPDAAGRRPRADIAVGRHRRRHGRLGGRTLGRLFRRRVDRRSARRRLRRPARLLRARSPHPRDPALHRVDQGCAQVHVGGQGRGTGQAGHRHQGRTACAKPPGRPQRIPARWPAPTTSTTPRFAARGCCA